MNKYKSFYQKNRNLLVHRGTVLEGLFTTEYQTAEIIENGYSHGVSTFAMLVTTNILDGWRYLFRSRSSDSFHVLCELHKRVANQLLEPPFYPIDRSAYYGKLRDYPVTVGTAKGDYIPPTSTREQVLKYLSSRRISSAESVLGVYIDLCKMQLFGDCNKRTAYMFANYLMIRYDLGYFFIIPDISHYNEYLSMLTRYYDGAITRNGVVNYLKQFLVKV